MYIETSNAALNYNNMYSIYIYTYILYHIIIYLWLACFGSLGPHFFLPPRCCMADGSLSQFHHASIVTFIEVRRFRNGIGCAGFHIRLGISFRATVRGVELAHATQGIAHHIEEAANLGYPYFVWILILALFPGKHFLTIFLAAFLAVSYARLKMIHEALLASRGATIKLMNGAISISQVVVLGAIATSAFRRMCHQCIWVCFALESSFSHQDPKTDRNAACQQ